MTTFDQLKAGISLACQEELLCLEHKDLVTIFQHYACSYWLHEYNNTYGLHLLLEIYHLCGEHF